MIPILLAIAAAQPATGFALIVTNNRSLDASRPDLRYADDDGIKYAKLFGEHLGQEQVVLLTEVDTETSALYPDFNQISGAPTHAELMARINTLGARLRAISGPSELYLVFAGHGDVHAGQGFVELADRRLTSTQLEQEVIRALPATRIHLILDSCNSYFMLNPRKPGGRRWASSLDPRGLLDRNPNVGAVISTSAEAMTYEWSEMQSGVFSYEVRSGLRGAADVDSDGQVTYTELAGFLQVANRTIKNDLYRPKVFLQAPGRAKGVPILALNQNQRRLRMPEGGTRRLTIRDQTGVRVLDIHKENGTSASLQLPPNTELVLTEFVIDGEKTRPSLVQRSIRADETETNIDELATRSTSLLQRSSAPVFRNAFKDPFGLRALADLDEQPNTAPRVYGVDRRDTDRLHSHLMTAAAFGQDERVGRAVAFFALPLGALIGASINTADEGRVNAVSGLLWGIGAVSLGAAIATLSTESDAESLLESFEAADLDNEESRSRAVAEAEIELERLAIRSRRRRLSSGGVGLAGAVATLGYGSLRSVVEEGRLDVDTRDAVFLITGGMMAMIGIYELFFHRYPIEHTYELYERQVRSERFSNPKQPIAPSLLLTDGGAQIGLGGRF